MKQVFKYFLAFFLLINLFIILSGKTWIYKGVSITYLRGHTSTYIHDFVHFPANTIKAGNHQEWLISKDYNKTDLPGFIDVINTELETTAFIIVKNDSIWHEKYWLGYSADSMSNSFSMAKSWVSTLIGVAIKDGKIKTINQPVCDFLPEFCVGENSKITIKHLLTMSSGLDWEEDYYNPLGSTAEAYYGNNLRRLIINLKSIQSPGEKFQYNSACTQLLTFILEAATKQTISEYASDKLWRPMGAKHPALWNTDNDQGDEKGFCCINSNARDFARLGKLYLSLGNWNGVQILDSSYIKNATSAANLIDPNGKKNKNYGYQFWVANYKNLHIYYSRGLWGQYVICIPEKDVIIVRLGKKYGRLLEDGHHDDFYAFINATLEILD
mgnify:CR=1 FL=1|tara:strand:+ start:1184 stop:2335 length:1152 start_codon:yes stop_codon:yes gene_type:complete